MLSHYTGLPLPLHLILQSPQPLQNRTIPQKALYPCLPCQREVAWRQGTSLDIVAFCLWHVHLFYLSNFSAVKTEGLLYTHQPLHSHNLLKSTSTASPRAKLASPRKRGGGLTALQNRYSTSSSFCNLLDCFQNCYTFCRQDGGDCVCLEDLKIVLLSISIPTVTARNSFRIVKAGLSEYCTASQKIISAVPPPLFRGEARVMAIFVG